MITVVAFFSLVRLDFKQIAATASVKATEVVLSTALAKHHANGDTSMVTEIVNLCPIM